MLRSSQAYFDVLVAQQSVQVAHNQEGAVKEQLALASENFQAGLTTVADVHEARARLALAQAQHVAARTELAGRHAEMHRLLGAPPPKLAGLAQGAQPATLEPAALEAWMDRADADNPQLRAQQLAVEVASQEVHRQAQAHGPSLDLSLGLARNSTTGSMTSPSELASRSHSTQVGVQLVIPIYAGVYCLPLYSSSSSSTAETNCLWRLPPGPSFPTTRCSDTGRLLTIWRHQTGILASTSG